MNFPLNQVVTFKMTSGEEIIAKVVSVETETGYIVIDEPVAIAHGPQGMGLVPGLFSTDTKQPIRLNTKNINLFAQTEEAVKLKYIQATTGISVPEKKIVLG